jgi:hypothetical protein
MEMEMEMEMGMRTGVGVGVGVAMRTEESRRVRTPQLPTERFWLGILSPQRPMDAAPYEQE